MMKMKMTKLLKAEVDEHLMKMNICIHKKEVMMIEKEGIDESAVAPGLETEIETEEAIEIGEIEVVVEIEKEGHDPGKEEIDETETIDLKKKEIKIEDRKLIGRIATENLEAVVEKTKYQWKKQID